MKSNLKSKMKAATAVALMAAASASHAAIDISAGVGEATADIKTAGGLIIGVVLAVAAFSWIRRVIK